MTHTSRHPRITSETLRPSAAALRSAASQSSSGTRTLRSVVPLGIDGPDQSSLECPGSRIDVIPADPVDARGVVDDGSEVAGLHVFDALADLEGSGECRDYRAAHVSECTYTCTYTQGVAA